MENHLLNDILAFCQVHGMAETAFGKKALNDWRLVKELRGDHGRTRRIWPETERTIRQFMATYRPADRTARAA